MTKNRRKLILINGGFLLVCLFAAIKGGVPAFLFCLVILLIIYFGFMFSTKLSAIEIVDGKLYLCEKQEKFEIRKEDIERLEWGYHSGWKRPYYLIELKNKIGNKNRIEFFDQERVDLFPIVDMFKDMWGNEPFPTLKKLMEMGLYKTKPMDPFYLNYKKYSE